MSRLLDDVVGELSRLPGVGRRTALRLAMHMLRMEMQDVELMAGAISRFRREIHYCSHCNNLSDRDICDICADETRDRTIVCVVEQVKDVISIENTRQYRGLYHVLGGIISPMQGIGPSDLKIDLLLDNIAQGGIKEVILALSTSVRRRDHIVLSVAPPERMHRNPAHIDRARHRVRRRVGLRRRTDDRPRAA